MDPRHPTHSLQGHLSPAQLRLVTAFKAAFAAVIAIGLAMAFGWTNPYWAGISVMVVTLPYMGASLEKGLMRVTGTIIAGILAYLISGAFIQDQVAYILCFSIIITICGYYGAGAWYPYAFTLCSLTLSILVTTSYLKPQLLWTDVFFRISEISLGVSVALAVNAIFWPQNAGRVLCTKLAKQLDACGQLFQLSVQQYTHDKPADHGGQSELERNITRELSALQPLLLQAQKDSSRVSHHRANYQHIFNSLESLFITLTILRHAVETPFPKAYQREFQTEFHALLQIISQTMLSLSESFQSGKPPAKISHDLRKAQHQLQDKINTVRQAGLNLNYDIEDTTQFYSIIANLGDLSRSLEDLADTLADINGNTRPSHRQPAPHRYRLPSKSIFKRPDKLRLTHGIKVAVACVLSLYTWIWLQWPGGPQAVITCTLVMQSTLVASNQKAILRLGGCLLGGTVGALSLIFLEPYFSSYLGFSIPFFLIIFFFGYIYYGHPSYAYAGFQAYIAFLLMTSISNTQNIDLLGGVQRFMGILLGVMIAMIVQRLLWPVIPEHKLKESFTEFFEQASRFLTSFTKPRILGENTEDALLILQQGITPSAASAESWLSQIALDKKNEHHRDQLRHFAFAAQTLSYRLRALDQAFEGDIPTQLKERLTPDILAISQICSTAFQQIAETFRNGQPPPDIKDSLEQAVIGMTRTITQVFRDEQAGRAYPGQQVAVLLRLARRYRSLANETLACHKLAADIDLRILDRSPFF